MQAQCTQINLLQFTDSFTTMFPIDGFKKLGDMCVCMFGGGGGGGATTKVEIAGVMGVGKFYLQHAIPVC